MVTAVAVFSVGVGRFELIWRLCFGSGFRVLGFWGVIRGSIARVWSPELNPWRRRRLRATRSRYRTWISEMLRKSMKSSWGRLGSASISSWSLLEKNFGYATLCFFRWSWLRILCVSECRNWLVWASPRRLLRWVVLFYVLFCELNRYGFLLLCWFHGVELASYKYRFQLSSFSVCLHKISKRKVYKRIRNVGIDI